MTAPAGEKLAYTMAEAADLIGVTETFLRDAVTERRIRHRRLGKGRGVRFTREDLTTFLDECVVQAQSEIDGQSVVAINRKRRTA
jgi:excisionase family DNA binding protein